MDPEKADAQVTHRKARYLDARGEWDDRAADRISKALAQPDLAVAADRISLIVGHLCNRIFEAGWLAGFDEAAAQAATECEGLVVTKEPLFGSTYGPLSDDWRWDDEEA